MDETDTMIVDAVKRGYQTAAQVSVAIGKDIKFARRHLDALVRYGILEKKAYSSWGGKPEYFYRIRTVCG